MATIVILGVVGQYAGPGLMRLVARTPDPLLAACETLGAKPERAGLTGWAEIVLPDSNQLTSLAGMNGLAARAVVAMTGDSGAPAAVAAVETTQPEGNLAEQSLTLDGATYRARCRRIGAGNRITLYLVCEVSLGRPEPGDLMRLRRQMVSALNTLGWRSRRPEPVYVTVRACLPGLLNRQQTEAAVKEVAGRLWGRLVSTMAQDAFHSVLIHATSLGPAVTVGGQPVNLGLVFSPDPESGCTRVTLGTPLCAGDY
jgi:hypothetical protein